MNKKYQPLGAFCVPWYMVNITPGVNPVHVSDWKYKLLLIRMCVTEIVDHRGILLFIKWELKDNWANCSIRLMVELFKKGLKKSFT